MILYTIGMKLEKLIQRPDNSSCYFLRLGDKIFVSDPNKNGLQNNQESALVTAHSLQRGIHQVEHAKAQDIQTAADAGMVAWLPNALSQTLFFFGKSQFHNLPIPDVAHAARDITVTVAQKLLPMLRVLGNISIHNIS